MERMIRGWCFIAVLTFVAATFVTGTAVKKEKEKKENHGTLVLTCINLSPTTVAVQAQQQELKSIFTIADPISTLFFFL